MQIKTDIEALLKTVVFNKASDLHLVSRAEPQIRIDGALRPLELGVLSGKDIEDICYTLITDAQKSELENNKELDFAVDLPNIGRFRGNYYYTTNGDLAAAFRVIPINIPSLDDLRSPLIFKELIKREKGLILVTGPTGSGKSTTLAAMLNEINLNFRKHIITVEDPVEFVHPNNKSLFSHRNVGTDTRSYAKALKYSLREDPDVILVGEMRDSETISTAITAAETGHLVFGTLHTNSSIQTINRIVDSFDGGEQLQVRNMLSSSLTAIISQSLLPKAGGGRYAVHEILINNPAIANLIRENRIHQIYSQMQLNQQQSGMSTQTQALVKAIKAGQITKDTAMRFATNQQELLNSIGAI
ncbi:type IV pilus twitching motility protein PilT [Campylobacter sp. RM9344]|uniref:Type IV pilus twitching motility protein PilT n=1 Tax=Campylobacter californiensis TaxID=1032243 RepID=A0AAW3ZWF8_9BACT|nr:MULTISPECIES: type IV pilus twitching motility protein PilT [unclassified Campylobacter]MBE2985126.1 type IV pilus twitching motility protein PilT [Campylobacter sp. RM6883]MBE2986415.1 type IV pilus twitching motility protein PilT [Campylobacter sp. RM12919]MBE2988713.1 type IV pilus twitching motility protein PilT [Campylobacter sp. RM12920]MBE2995717.1 type IV pilus twitching motility protein PilT [Campylobacter sp. RM6913]MBE3022814.1 type IV pilus twitching motility protein PilT [Campy